MKHKIIKKDGKEWIAIRDLCYWRDISYGWKIVESKKNPDFTIERFKGLPSGNGSIFSRDHITTDQIDLFIDCVKKIKKNKENKKARIIEGWVPITDLCRQLGINPNGKISMIKDSGIFTVRKFKNGPPVNGQIHSRYHIRENQIPRFKKLYKKDSIGSKS